MFCDKGNSLLIARQASKGTPFSTSACCESEGLARGLMAALKRQIEETHTKGLGLISVSSK